MSSVEAPTAPISFGVFEADLSAGELRKNGVKIRIQDLPFRALTLLLTHPGVVIPRDQFRQALWPADVFVDFEQGISSAIKRLRDALGDSADNPIFIETIERRGYRWIGPVQQPALVAAKLEVASPPTKTLPWKTLAVVLMLAAIVVAAWLVRQRISPGQKAARAGSSHSHHAANREAEDFYLKGRFFWNKRTPESLNAAVDAFTQAIVHDPNYSDAYVGLADCYNLLREYSVMPPNEAYSRAYAAAKRAVELDGKSSEAHASLAFVTFYGRWDTATADQEFRRAIELDPRNSNAHHWYATYFHNLGRNNDALAEIERAQELDPNSSSVLADKGRLLWAAGRRDEALRLLQSMVASEPTFASPHRYLKYAYFDVHDYASYLAEMKIEAQLTHDPDKLAEAEAAANGYAEGGERGMFEKELAEQTILYKQGKASSYLLAQGHARLGHDREALHYLGKCIEAHDELALWMSSDPNFSRLHSNADFQQLLAKVQHPAGDEK